MMEVALRIDTKSLTSEKPGPILFVQEVMETEKSDKTAEHE